MSTRPGAPASAASPGRGAPAGLAPEAGYQAPDPAAALADPPRPDRGAPLAGAKDHEAVYGAALTAGVSLFGALFQAVLLPVLVLQVRAAPAWFQWFAGVPYLLGPLIPICGALLAVAGTRRGSRQRAQAMYDGARAGVAIFLILHLWTSATLLLAHHRDPAQPVLLSHGPPLTAYAAVTLAAFLGLALSRRKVIVLLGALAALEMVVHVTAGREIPAHAALSVSYNLCLWGIDAFALCWLMDCARQLDAEDSRSRQEEGYAAGLTARLMGLRHTRGMVHDRVLTALVAAFPERGVPSDRVRAEAVEALDLLESRSLEGAPCSASELVEHLRTWCRRHSRPDLRFTVTSRLVGTGAEELPGDVFVDLSAAALEALRNVAQHAAGGSRGQRVGCDVVVTNVGGVLRVSITDDGVGFDPDAIGPARLGLRSSVIERMEALPGGGVWVHSTPRYGTTVALTWNPGAVDCESPEPEPLSRTAMALSVEGGHARLGIALMVATAWAHALWYLWYWESPASPMAALACAAVCTVGCAAVARPCDGRMSRWQTMTTVACCAVGPTLFLASWTPAPALAGQGWPYGYAALTIALLMYRSRIHSAWTALGLLTLGSAAIVAIRDLPVRAVALAIALQIFNTAAVWAVTLLVRSVERRRGAHRCLTRQARLRAVAGAARLHAEDNLIAEVGTRARPALAALARIQGEPGASVLGLVRSTEAELRDLMRVPRMLGHPELADAVHRARLRGVKVSQVDDAAGRGWEPGSEPALPEGFVAAATRVLGEAAEGQTVMLRLCPAHSPMAATVQRRGPEGMVDVVEVARGG